MDQMKIFMRIVLDDMPEDPDPIAPGEQATVAGYDSTGALIVSWDNGRELNLIPGVDKYHAVGMTESDEQNDAEIKKCFDQYRRIQDKLKPGEDSRCPRCGAPFDAKRGAVSRRVEQVMICPVCGQQEAIEAMITHISENGKGVHVFVPTDKNLTGYETEEPNEDGRRELKVEVKQIPDWYIVKIWQGREL